MLSSGTDSGSPANGALRMPPWGFPGSYNHPPSMWGWVQTFTSYFDIFWCLPRWFWSIYQGNFRLLHEMPPSVHAEKAEDATDWQGRVLRWGGKIIITADMYVMCLYLSIFPSIHPSFHKEFTYRFTYSDIDLHKDLHMPIYPSIHPSLYIHLYISICIYPSVYIHLSIYLSIYLSPTNHPSIHPSIHLSIHLSIIYLYLNCSIPGFSISSHGLTAFASRARPTAQLHLTPVVAWHG